MTEGSAQPSRVVRLAASGVTPERLQRVIAGLLDDGAEATPRQALDALERWLRRTGRLAGTDATHRALELVERAGARVLVAGEAGFPERLARLWPQLGAPLWLFTRGRELPAGPTVALVGTRAPSLDGLRTARELGALCAAHGVAVVSGMARGIDQAAHAATLELGGVTTAVLGTGLGVDYPRGATGLREAVERSGGLVAEVLPGTPPQPAAFLRRNRLISGLADVCVVVEGRARSGALHTAGLAAAQGREVCAVPGSPHQPTAQTPLALTRDGARCLGRIEDLLDVLAQLPSGQPSGGGRRQPLGPEAPTAAGARCRHGRQAAAGHPRGRTRPVLTGMPAAVHALLGPTPATAGEVAAALGCRLAEVLAALAALEEQGAARTTPRGYVRLPVGGRG